MFKCAVTPTVSMGLLDVSHADAWMAAIAENREHLRPWFAWVDPDITREDALRFLQGAMGQYASGTGLKVGIWQGEILVGSLSVQEYDWGHHSATLGYWLSAKAQGQGIITQCLSALMAQLSRQYGIVRFEARCVAQNQKSRAVLERLGFVAEAHLTESLWLRDHFENEVLYGKQVGL